MKDKEPVRGKQYDAKLQNGVPYPQSEHPQSQHHCEAPQKASRVPLRLAAVALRFAWPLIVKMFPWLGWLSFIVYTLTELLSK